MTLCAECADPSDAPCAFVRCPRRAPLLHPLAGGVAETPHAAGRAPSGRLTGGRRRDRESAASPHSFAVNQSVHVFQNTAESLHDHA